MQAMVVLFSEEKEDFFVHGGSSEDLTYGKYGNSKPAKPTLLQGTFFGWNIHGIQKGKWIVGTMNVTNVSVKYMS